MVLVLRGLLRTREACLRASRKVGAAFTAITFSLPEIPRHGEAPVISRGVATSGEVRNLFMRGQGQDAWQRVSPGN